MNCDENRELILDVVYGEEMNSRTCFDFFKHLDSCPDCSGEYKEFLTTRETLQEWEVEEPPDLQVPAGRLSKPWLQKQPRRRFELGSWWPTLQKVAAGFLILMGVVSIFQHYGYLGGRKVLVSEQRLTEMMQDLIVVNQKDERKLIGQMLVHLKEDVEFQRKEDMQDIYNNLVSLQQRYNDNLEESNRYLKVLLER
ncbi:MAG: hypothetical protein EHM61_03795 [Acidobacteria bacterium]|nr:MAG: hypothetical protein EHM61_03795 [Acidobacteriota bacterium]